MIIQCNIMILYVYRSREGIQSDEVFATLFEPIFQENGRFYGASSWTKPVRICSSYSRSSSILYLEKGECKPIRLERLKAIISEAGKICGELEELEYHDNQRKMKMNQALLRVLSPMNIGESK